MNYKEKYDSIQFNSRTHLSNQIFIYNRGITLLPINSFVKYYINHSNIVNGRELLHIDNTPPPAIESILLKDNNEKHNTR